MNDRLGDKYRKVEQQKTANRKKIVQIEDLSVFDGMEVVKHVNIEGTVVRS